MTQRAVEDCASFADSFIDIRVRETAVTYAYFDSESCDAMRAEAERLLAWYDRHGSRFDAFRIRSILSWMYEDRDPERALAGLVPRRHRVEVGGRARVSLRTRAPGRELC